MLRNTGVNVTEHKIRQDVQKAYEYDYLHECSRYGRRRDQEVRYMGNKTHIRRQPRYYNRRHLPSYYHSARSSILSYTRHPESVRAYGVKRIYLAETDSGESSYFIRKPSYREKYYSNQKPYHIAEVERPLRRDFSFNPESPKRTSSMYLDEKQKERLMDATRCLIDNYCPKYSKPVRKITKKLSPILTHDSPIRTHQKAKCNNLSKEAKLLSQDIFDILTLLQKAEAEEEEQYSSDSVLQRVHNFDCSSTNNITRRKTDLITEHVQIYPKMDKKRQEPLAKLKNITGVRSKLEALVNILKQYEYNSGSKADILPKNENPPSLEDVKSCNDKTKECQGRNDIVLQTEETKTSNKSICGMIMKNNSIEVVKSLKSRFSSKVKEKINTKKRKESDKQKMVKQDEGKTMFNYKETSKDKTLSENKASKQNLADNCHEIKTGLMITIGGKVLRKKLAAPEKRLDKMSKTWIKKYLDTKKDTKDNNIHKRWNNRAFYNHSSTTVVEVINNVYKQMGINLKSKYYDVSRKSHTSGKSPNKTRNRQTVQAYMMPQTVMHDHVYMSEDILIAKRQVTKNIQKLIFNTKLPFEQNINLQNKSSTYSNILNLSNDPSSIFFRIYMSKDYFDTVSTSDQTLKISTSDERVYKVTEYEATRSGVLKKYFTGNGSLKGDKLAIVHNKEKNDVQVNHGASNLCFLPKCELKKKIVSQQNIKNTAKLEHQMQESVDDEANLYTPETSNVRAREKLTHSQNAKIRVPYLIASSNIQSNHNKKSEDTELQFIVVYKSTKVENIKTTVTEDFTEADHIGKFYSSRSQGPQHAYQARTLPRCQKVDTKSNNYIGTKRDHTTSCRILNSGNHAMHQPYPVTKKAPSTFSFSSMISSFKMNAVVSTVTLFGNRKYDRNSTSTSCREPKSKVQSSSKDKLYPKVKRTFSEWLKYVKKYTIKTNEKIKMQMKTEVRDATSSAYLLVEPYRSQEKLYNVVDNDTFQNKNPVKIGDESETLNYDPINDILHNVTNSVDILQSDTVKKGKILNNVTNPAEILQSNTVKKGNSLNNVLTNPAEILQSDIVKKAKIFNNVTNPADILQSETVKKAKILNNVTYPADILQSDKVKKAVLQIYIEDSNTHKDYMVAKLPKFLSL